MDRARVWEGLCHETASRIIDTDSITGHKTVPWPTGKSSGIRLHECLSATTMLVSKDRGGDEMQKLGLVAGFPQRRSSLVPGQSIRMWD